MLQQLSQFAEDLAKNGKVGNVEVIEEIWQDGGGAPVFLEDVINYFLKQQEKCGWCDRSKHHFRFNYCPYCGRSLR